MNDACWFICRWTQGIGRTTKTTKALTQKSYQLLNSSWMHNRQHRRIWNVWKTERSSSYPTDHELTKKRWKRGIWSVGKTKTPEVWGNPSGLLILFKSRKVRSDKEFFPGKTCKPFACKRNYFVLQSETATFSCWRKRTVECINVIKWTMLKGNYFVFSCVSLTVRVFDFLNLGSCWMFFSIFFEIFSTMSNDCLHRQLAIWLLKYL